MDRHCSRKSLFVKVKSFLLVLRGFLKPVVDTTDGLIAKCINGGCE